ncbi:MAG: hypothetical protein ABIT09_10350 [Croceibacterium sp.]
MTPEEQERFTRARRGRNLALGLVLTGLVVLFYAMTIARIGGQ